MKECPNCKTMIDENVKYCYNCGKKVDEVIRNDNNSEEKTIKTKKCKYCQTEINVKAKVCPQCHSKLKSFNIWKVLLVIIICTCFFLFVSYYYYRYSIGYNEYGENNVDEYINDYRENEKEKNNVRFSLLEHGYSSDTNEYITYIEGKIKNNGTYDVDYITVTFTLYDANGNNIGTCSDINNGLKGRETWKFKAMCTAEINEIDHYELKEIYGD